MIALLALAFILAVVVPAFAEDPAVTPAQAQKDEVKNLRKEIVKLKYVRAQDIQNLLYAYTSREGHIQFNPSMPAILSVSDTPENVEKILAAIREIDVKPADVLYTVQLVLGSEADAATDAELQADPIVKELRKLLRFKGYTLLDVTLVRTINRESAAVKFGPKAEFELYLKPDVAGDAKMPVIKTEVRLRRIEQLGFSAEKPITNVATLVESTLNIKSGDRTVVGVSKLDGGDKGLILIISAKIVD
ncbi:MAG: hypothetical protein M0C28_14715 [Candidatus Moduliflexus flocculans]|nr:hypothetical protein [Candidatus Moduliflexus flocculans]